MLLEFFFPEQNQRIVWSGNEGNMNRHLRQAQELEMQ
jgi:hypothetical protein